MLLRISRINPYSNTESVMMVMTHFSQFYKFFSRDIQHGNCSICAGNLSSI